MKKVLYTILVLSGFCLSALAQVQNSRQTTASSKVTHFAEKMAAIRDCQELNEQLIKLFGNDYTVSDPQVMVQLEKNVSNKSASTCIRKKSLYGIYGEDYIDHLNLIEINTNLKTKK